MARQFGPLARLRRALAPRGSLDAFTGSRVGGWALGRGPIQVEAWLDGVRLVYGQPQIGRADVAAAYPESSRAGTSGFAFDLPPGAIHDDFLGELRIVAKPLQRWMPSATIASVRAAGAGVVRGMAHAPDSGITGPFPKGVIDAVASRWPDVCRDLATAAGQRDFVRRLLEIMATPELNALPVFADYARYLVTTMAHCQFVRRHFPSINARAQAGASDFHCKPNSVSELFPIIHQLYVLKSWGVEGDFDEFGCFKGYSSAMLSFACRQLGVHMHVFDSFEGLPPSGDSGYETGQFAGSLDEVRDHVARFGSIEAVTFHKGFFADTFRDWRPPHLMCLWMDVDLEVSALDLMVVADRLDARAGLFSHECTAGLFQSGVILNEPRPDNPIPPMLTRHEHLGRPLTGQFVAGYTGAFWPRNGGIPVIDADILTRMVADLERAA